MSTPETSVSLSLKNKNKNKNPKQNKTNPENLKGLKGQVAYH